MEKSLTIFKWLLMGLCGCAWVWALVSWTLYSLRNSDPQAWVLMISTGVVFITLAAVVVAWLLQPVIFVLGLLWLGVTALVTRIVHLTRHSHV